MSTPLFPLRSPAALARRTLALVVAIAASLGVGACQNDGYDLRHTPLDVRAQGVGTIGIATHDRRPYVRQLDRTPAFVGFALAEGNATTDYTTASGLPLADEFNRSLARALTSRGFDSQPVVVDAIDRDEQALRKLRGLGARTSVFITMRDWKFITTTGTKLYFDLTLAVLDRDGTVRASKTETGEEDLGAPPAGTTQIDTAKFVRTVMLDASRRKLETMLNDPGITAALK